MGKAKKIMLVLLVLVAVIGVFFLQSYAFYHSKNLHVFAKCSSYPSSDIISLNNISEGLVIFPAFWNMSFRISVQNSNPDGYQMEEVTYVISLGDRELSQGTFHSLYLPVFATTQLPNVTMTLSIDEIAQNSPQLIVNALKQRGEFTFKISVTIKTPATLFGWLRIGTAQATESLSVSASLVDSISVSSFRWEKENRITKEGYPGEVVEGHFYISRKGSPVGSLIAQITEIGSDGIGRETVLTEQELKGDLKPLYGEFNVSCRLPDSPAMDCIGFSIRLLYGGVEVWAAPFDPPSLQLVRRYTLLEAILDEKVDVNLTGRGYCAGDAIQLEVKGELDVSIDLEIEAGTVLLNGGSGQNMIVGESSVIRVKPNVEVELKIEAYCLDLHKDNPTSSEVFDIPPGSGGYADDAVKLMQSLKNVTWENKSISGVQLALWAIIENPSKSEVEQVFVVSQSSLEDAAWFLQNIGIDPATKRLFSSS